MGSVPAYSIAAAVTAPTLGQVLCSLTTGPGAFACAYVAYYTGTLTGTIDQDNIALQSDPLVKNSFVTAQVVLQQPIDNEPLVINHFLVYAQSMIQLVSIAAGSTGATYHLQLNAVYPGPSGAFL
jgi:hypothetical protein